MSRSLSNNDLVRNEQIARNKNTQVKNGIKKYFQDDSNITSTPLPFICECSDSNCKKHIKISIDAYEKTHRRKDLFTIKKGHETSEVEEVVAKKPGFDIVEKEELSA